MKPIKSIIILLLIAVSSYSCTSDTTSDTNEFTDLEALIKTDVSYGNHESQTYDIYLPEHRDIDTKTLILVHGGGWTSGDKNDMNGFVALIQKDLPNTAIVNMNYRLVDESTEAYPTQINDISAVINHLNANLDAYQISDDFGFIGTSAGAHLALLWSYAFNENELIKMVCSIVGPTNFTDPAYLENLNFNTASLLENLYGIDLTTEFLETVSPYHQVTAAAPPTVLFYGGKDPLVPTSQGDQLQHKLQELGIMHEYTLYPEAGHGWAGLELLDTWSKLKSFIEAHLD
ncbi:putative carbohydrate esterase (CE10) [Formosa agariphila KMM 3901]|uniref:Putative carbohydrate esterase (CE10) n=1 Tax=Formosa agariphila (strain DSM 15362 / KCTC 12365 / LMG 23005 / KMM 3901 / M-2Alg 35-1) TaxID=1347342 RepID=T2KLI3_FORAG|nr:alpha/beta hydrolase [Formosa agariphila]CDF78839.1 putative carbohydrate esterase (CE10) [Formosa agariphila KMM 3901]